MPFYWSNNNSFSWADHGCPQTFFQGSANFSGGEGAKTSYLPIKHLKRYYFPPKKVKKHTILAAREPPLAFPCGHPWSGSNLARQIVKFVLIVLYVTSFFIWFWESKSSNGTVKYFSFIDFPPPYITQYILFFIFYTL